jgi:signal transduction histidine kinase
VPTAFVRPLCYGTLVAAWLVDLVTPQLFVAAIFMNVPIALSSLVFDERLTRTLVGLAIAANISAGYVDGLTVGAHWDAIAIGDRVVSGFSFLLVGLLTIASQRSSRTAGELAERNERNLREQRVNASLERVRSSMSTELVQRAVVREGHSALEADLTWLIEAAPAGQTLIVRGRGDVDVERTPPAAPIASLVPRVFEAGAPLRIEATGALGRLALDTLAARDAIAAPIADASVQFGILIVATTAAAFDDGALESVQLFCEGAAAALAQSALFEQLARRNDQLASLNASLSERTEVIRDIVYALSHDLRTPLTAAGMTMRQALDGRYGTLPEAYRTILEQSIRSNDELQRLAETLLLVSKYESGEGSQRRERVDARALAGEVAAELLPLAQNKSLNLTLDGPSAAVLADPGELRRAIVNLLANAITWSKPGGRITIAIATDGPSVTMTVQDEGFGVPAGLRDRMFERMVGESRSGAGSGLGLYIVRRIAAGLGGSVAYEPREAGGSRFTLSIPSARA